MLDIRTLLLLLTPEDRYQPSPALRTAERAVYPLLRSPAQLVTVRRAAERKVMFA